jgi:hypothetical protein
MAIFFARPPSRKIRQRMNRANRVAGGLDRRDVAAGLIDRTSVSSDPIL